MQEERRINARSPAHLELMLSKNADEEEDEEEEEEEEEGEEGEEGEEAEEAEEAEGEEEEEEVPHEEDIFPKEQNDMTIAGEDPYFSRDETLRGKFNEVEVDAFMRLLDIRPSRQW